jgi:hypothetical protein
MHKQKFKNKIQKLKLHARMIKADRQKPIIE